MATNLNFVAPAGLTAPRVFLFSPGAAAITAVGDPAGYPATQVTCVNPAQPVAGHYQCTLPSSGLYRVVIKDGATVVLSGFIQASPNDLAGIVPWLPFALENVREIGGNSEAANALRFMAEAWAQNVEVNGSGTFTPTTFALQSVDPPPAWLAVGTKILLRGANAIRTVTGLVCENDPNYGGDLWKVTIDRPANTSAAWAVSYVE